jgi:hypothetical protein
MPTKTKKKTIPVKSLYGAIKNGMSIKEAAKHAMASLKGKLHICDSGDWGDEGEEPDMEAIIEFLVEKNDHSIRFEAKEDREGGLINWYVCVRPYREEVDFIYYFATERTLADFHAEEDAFTLSRFVLDFYGIKEHAEIKKTKKEIRTEISLIRDEIKEKKAEIKVLEAKMSKLYKSL